MSDLISRQAAIDALAKELKGVFVEYKDIAEKLIGKLPSAQLHTRGRWIGTDYDGFADGNPVYDEWKCSECGCVVEDEEPTWNFCPNCGADMRGEQDGKNS